MGDVMTDETICANCGKPIYLGFTVTDGYQIWHLGAAEGRHTVCDWWPGMAPTTRVATPVRDAVATTPGGTPYYACADGVPGCPADDSHAHTH